MPSPLTSHRDQTYHLIANHAAAFAQFETATGLTDEVLAKQLGRDITAEDEQAYNAANEAEEEAFRELIGHVPEGVSQLRRWAGYLEMHVRGGGGLESHEQLTLLAVLTQFART